MDVRVGNYIIRSDAYCMWMDEEYEGKTKNNEPKIATRQVAGYVANFAQLLENFSEKKIRRSDATEVKEVLAEFAKCEADIKKLIEGYKDGK